MATADLVPVIQATLAPMFLVSGGAIFLNFTQARLFRVVDRLRAFAKERGSGAPGTVALIEHKRNLRRAVILRNAILLGTLVIAFTVLTALLLLLAAAFGFDAGRAALTIFAVGLVCFMAALALVVVDAFLSVAAALADPIDEEAR